VTSSFFARRAICGPGKLYREGRAVGRKTTGVVFGKMKKILLLFRPNEIDPCISSAKTNTYMIIHEMVPA